jgi:hypothetical protein
MFRSSYTCLKSLQWILSLWLFLTSLTKLLKPNCSMAWPCVRGDNLFGYLLRNKKVVNYEVSFIKCISENALSAFNVQFLCKCLMITTTGIETCSWMIWNKIDSRVWTDGWAFFLNDSENHNAMAEVRTLFYPLGDTTTVPHKHYVVNIVHLQTAK